MSDYGSLILSILFVASLAGCVNSVYRYEKGKIIKELKALKKQSTMTKLLVEEYKHFFEFKWWHWLSWVAFVVSVVGIFYDSY